MSFYGEFAGIDNDGVARPTRISAEAFGSLSADYMRQIGVKDVKGTPKGIDIQDFQSEDNYLRLTQAMFNPGDTNYDEAQTQKIFREYKIKQITDRVAANWKMSPKNPANQQTDNNQDGLSFLPQNKNEKSQIKGDKGVYTPNSAINEIAKLVQPDANGNRQNIKIQGQKDMFTWDTQKQTYMYSETVVPNKDNLFASIFGEDFTPLNILPLYNSIEDWDGSAYIKEKESESKKEETKKKGNFFTNLFK